MAGTREQLAAMGERLWGETRTELYLAMRFLGPALGALRPVMDLQTTTFGTDGESIRYNPNFVLRAYLERPRILARGYLHVLMHCLFRHLFHADQYADEQLWDISCDIAAEAVIDSMDEALIHQVPDALRQEWYDRLEGEVHVLSAERIYSYLSQLQPDFDTRQRLLREFVMDDHSFWKRLEDKKKDPPPQRGGGGGPQKDPPQEREPDAQSRPPQVNADQRRKLTPQEEEWKNKARRTLSQLQSRGREASQERGSLERMLSLAAKSRTDYREFLKRFSVVREEARVDPDSFDYGYYALGMELYGNMPLIEENEYRESRRVEQLVIAIDTSASCQAHLVQRFLEETAAILQTQETFFHHMDLHIIECDDQVQLDERITDLEQVRRFARGFAVRGGYGTDFRPVFAHVEQLRRSGELDHLAGLLYFTDGFGTYPSRATDYETAFIFSSQEECGDRDCPSWAVKLYV